MELGAFEEFAFLLAAVEGSAVHRPKFDEISFFYCVPFVERKAKGSEMPLMRFLLHEVDESRHLRVEVFITFFNFEVRAHILLN